MTGYQESLTDPSFAGQVLTFTYPLIGNYGIHHGTSESAGVWPRGVVVRHAMKNPDHRDSVASISEFLSYHNVPGIEEIDTRAITRRVREYGCVLCVFGPLEDEDQLREHLDQLTSPELEDLVDLVSIDQPVIVNEGASDDLEILFQELQRSIVGLSTTFYEVFVVILRWSGVHQIRRLMKRNPMALWHYSVPTDLEILLIPEKLLWQEIPLLKP